MRKQAPIEKSTMKSMHENDCPPFWIYSLYTEQPCTCKENTEGIYRFSLGIPGETREGTMEIFDMSF